MSVFDRFRSMGTANAARPVRNTRASRLKSIPARPALITLQLVLFLATLALCGVVGKYAYDLYTVITA